MLERKLAFIAAVCVAAAVEGAVIYAQWPSPSRTFCVSEEFGELLAVAAKTEAELKEARARMQRLPDEAAAKEVMRLEAASAAASGNVARYKQAQARKQPDARAGSCRP